jgi:hypothetical protein
MRRILILGLLIVMLVWAFPSVFAYGGMVLAFVFGPRVDPLPDFMAEQRCGTYDEARGRFSEFAVKAFPIGSAAKDAIARATGQGFRITGSNSNSVELSRERVAGICTYHYRIIVDRNADGTITTATCGLHTICL